MIWLGVYPKPILEPINKGVENVMAIMQSRIVTQEALNFFGLEVIQESNAASESGDKLEAPNGILPDVKEGE